MIRERLKIAGNNKESKEFRRAIYTNFFRVQSRRNEINNSKEGSPIKSLLP